MQAESGHRATLVTFLDACDGWHYGIVVVIEWQPSECDSLLLGQSTPRLPLHVTCRVTERRRSDTWACVSSKSSRAGSPRGPA